MKKNLKTLLILLTIIVGVAGVNTKASAFKNSYNTYSVGTYNFWFDDNIYFTETKYSADGLNAYCADSYFPHSGGYTRSSILGTSGDIKTKAYELGLLEILKEGEKRGYTSYYETNAALRTYIYGFGYGLYANNAKWGIRYKNAYYVKTFINWASSYVDVVNAITSAGCSSSNFSSCYTSYLVYNAGYDWYNYQKSSVSSIVGSAQDIFDIGMNKARAVLNGNDGGVASIKGSTNSTATNRRTINGDNDDTAKIQEYHHQTLEFKNFNKASGYIKNFSLSCADCAKQSITVDNLEIFNKTTNKYETYADVIASGTNFLTGDALKNYVTTSGDTEGNTVSGSIKFRFKVTRIKYNESCVNPNYKINYAYYDPSLIYTGALLEPYYTGQQRFYIVTENDDGQNAAIEGTINCTITCDTELEMPICSEDEADAVARVDGPIMISSCVINESDDAGNSYQYTKNAGGVSNDYCNVYCKEDYAEIKLNPIIKDVKCGGYFQLTSKVTGKKTCYTGGTTSDDRINKEQYLKDIKYAQEKLVDAMNNYNLYTAMKNYTNASENGNGSVIIAYGSYTVLTFNWDGQNGSFTQKTESGKTATFTDLDTYKSMVETRLNSAISDLSKYTSDYNRIISDYNACTTGWTNEYAFAQELKYYYDENRGENGVNYSPYFDLIKDNEELQKLEKYGTEKVETVISICKGNIDKRYNCSDGNSVTLNADSDVENSGVFSSKTYVTCTTDGCTTETRQISDATYVKKEVKKEQKYITPTSFYQIAANGKVVAYDNYSFKNITLEELTNMLPTSTNSVGGGVFKLMVSGLGEFYSESGVYGRLIDFNGINETKSVAYKKGVDVYKGEYVCYYENQCRPKDCPNCEFICTGTGCEWIECPDCDIICINCLFNQNELNLNIKTITTTDVGAANRSYGYNWVTSSSIESLQLLHKKAQTTIEEIEEVNEMVYDDKTTDGSALGFSIKLTSEVVNKITEYNKANEDNGGYINNSLKCYDATIDGTTYKSIYCYSELIDKLLEENGDNVTVLPSRVNDESRRASDSNSSGYWTLWKNYKIDKTSDSVIGGPAWK